MIKEFKGTKINCSGIFISNVKAELDPDNVGGIYQVGVNENLEIILKNI